MTKHWTHVAADRIDAGEDEIECLADYGYVPTGTDVTQAVRDTVKLTVEENQRLQSQLEAERTDHAELVKTACMLRLDLNDSQKERKGLRQLLRDFIQWHEVMAYSDPDEHEAQHEAMVFRAREMGIE